MKRQILSLDKDEIGDWRALLECGHYQHVRHDPPLITREWVLSPEGRAERIGQLVECKKCGALRPLFGSGINDVQQD